MWHLQQAIGLSIPLYITEYLAARLKITEPKAKQFLSFFKQILAHVDIEVVEIFNGVAQEV